MIHGWYDGSDVGCPSGKEQHRILENLTKQSGQEAQKLSEELAIHLEDILKLACHIPVIFAQLILPQLHITIASDGVDCCDVLDSKVEHVKGRVPLGPDITGDYTFGYLEVLKDGEPLW